MIVTGNAYTCTTINLEKREKHSKYLKMHADTVIKYQNVFLQRQNYHDLANRKQKSNFQNCSLELRFFSL